MWAVDLRWVLPLADAGSRWGVTLVLAGVQPSQVRTVRAWGTLTSSNFAIRRAESENRTPTLLNRIVGEGGGRALGVGAESAEADVCAHHHSVVR